LTRSCTCDICEPEIAVGANDAELPGKRAKTFTICGDCFELYCICPGARARWNDQMTYTCLSMVALRSKHDLLCGTYARFHLLCANCQRCVGFAREAVERVPCAVCGGEATEVYLREPFNVVASLNA
jgi:hypothetical protein